LITVDTHVVFWLADAPEKLSPAAHTAIAEERQRDGLAISCQTLWELSMLLTRRRIHMKTSLLDFLESVERHFIVLPLTSAIAGRAEQFSDEYPKDPSDRIIGATALVHGMRLVTKDGRIHSSKEVDCVW
jgi:PIN domain nuclease of toxin-antitoxin system